MYRSSNTNHSRYIVLLLYVLLFVLILYLNVRTPLICDDFAYVLDFSKGWDLPYISGVYPPIGADRIVHVSQIFESMYYHRLYQGGRVITHFLVQLFLLLPDIVFDIANSIMFIARLLLINMCVSRICKHSALAYSSIISLGFAAIWIFEPSFGEVSLWLDGSINYLWVSVAVLFYFYHSLRLFDNCKYFNNDVLNVLFVLFSFITGSLHEVSGIVIVGISVCITCYTKFIKKDRISSYVYLSILSAILGTLFIATAPADLDRYISHDINTLSLTGIINKISYLLNSSYKVIPLLAIYVLLIVFLRRRKPDSSVIKYSYIVLIATFCSFLPFVMGSYIPSRCFWLMTDILTMGIVMILFELYWEKLSKLRIDLGVSVITMAIASIFVFTAIKDINFTYNFIKTNEQYIIQCKEDGITHIEIPEINRAGLSMYSPLYDLKYVDYYNPDMWPNNFMAKYYGVDSISFSGEFISP